MTPRAPALALLLAAALAACEVPTVSSSGADAADAAGPDTAAPDTAGDTGAAPDTSGLLACDPAEGAAACPDGLFCSPARVCVECLTTTARCTASGQREICEKPVVIGLGEVEGGVFEPAPCASGEACVASGATASCKPKVCTPGLRRCPEPTLAEVCDASGTSRVTTECSLGWACYEGACQPLRHNVLLVFDTSGSMHDYVDAQGSAADCVNQGTPCPAPWPACDDPANPLTIFTLAKKVFAENVQAAVGGFAQFALQRFPQRAIPQQSASCFYGYYGSLVTLTGDDDAKAPPPGGWLDQHLGEAVVVPFPRRTTIDNTEALGLWLDFEETLAPTDVACQTNGQCQEGPCLPADGGLRCFAHDNPELRASGPTPLGKSLFYAGEYMRRFVLVDGQPCQSATDCGSAGYVCVDGACRDPYRHCRDSFIVLFTDGAESENKDPDDFFSPTVQAKRLAYGLGCAGDDDCRGPASCVGGVCLAPGQLVEECVAPEDCGPGGSCLYGQCVSASTPWDGVDRVPAYVDPDGYDALTRPDGSGISIRTHVITLDATGASTLPNRRIAAAGGGEAVDATATDPAALKKELFRLMSPNFKCQPEDLTQPSP